MKDQTIEETPGISEIPNKWIIILHESNMSLDFMCTLFSENFVMPVI